MLLIVYAYDSSEATTTRAKVLADEVGSWHLNVSIDGVISSLISLFQTLTGKRPRYKVEKFEINFTVNYSVCFYVFAQLKGNP